MVNTNTIRTKASLFFALIGLPRGPQLPKRAHFPRTQAHRHAIDSQRTESGENDRVEQKNEGVRGIKTRK